MKSNVFSTLFIELDALLDSRASVIYKLDPEYLKNQLTTDYFNRLSDEFELESYKEIYLNRNKEILRNSIVTNIGGLLVDFCEKTLENTVKSPFHYDPKIIINIHPYELQEEEINNIISAIVNLTNGAADVEAVNMSYEDLTPAYVKSKLTVLVLYDYVNWLETQSLNKNFEKTTCPDVSLFGPKIAFKKLLSVNQNEMSPFDAMEQLVAPLINLKLLPIENFCFVKQVIKQNN